MQSGAIVDLPNSRGQTPLHLACISDRADNSADAIVRLLLDAGASANARDNEVWRIYVAVFVGD